MFCMKCGTEIPEWAKFCTRCGNPVPESVVAENSAVENPVPVKTAPENAAPVGTMPADSVVPENPEVEKHAAENPAAENPVPMKTMPESAEPADSVVPENPEVENPVPENIAPGNPASENSAAERPSVQEKLAAVKPAIDKVGKTLESAKPAIDKVGKTLESAKPVVGKMGDKLKEKSGKKKLPIIIGAIVVAFVLIMLLRGGGNGPGSGFSSPEKAFDAWMTGFCLQDFDLTLQAEPDFVIEHEGGEARLKETLQRNYYNTIGASAGAGISKFEATGHTMLEKDELEELKQRMENAYGVDVKISDAAVIHHRLVDLTDDSASDGGTTGTTGYAFKYKGKWYYLNVESR